MMAMCKIQATLDDDDSHYHISCGKSVMHYVPKFPYFQPISAKGIPSVTCIVRVCESIVLVLRIIDHTSTFLSKFS